MINENPLLLTDWYKLSHTAQYPPGTQRVYANWTPRGSRIPDINEVVVFGIQYFIKYYLMEGFNKYFFDRPRARVIDEIRQQVRESLGKDLPSYDHIEYLYKMSYLPLRIKALPEGTLCPMRVPFGTIVNTEDANYWLTNAIETLSQCCTWQPITSATIAHEYRKLLDHYAKLTGMDPAFVPWQGHDFSMRGMSSPQSAVLSGMGHLLSFTGTDTIPAIRNLKAYYKADTGEMVGGSVPATEHAVMCAGGKVSEYDTFLRLITKVYPDGIVSIVSDTWDLWHVISDTVPRLKDVIMARDGKVVFRPDSGNPVKILCGDPEATDVRVRKGVVELLWDIFGGTMTSTGYKLLDCHIGTIYGDAITRARGQEIAERLAAKGFANQALLGIGSYTYQYNTRDTFGLAMKSTNVVIDGVSMPICKTPVTDNGVKNSANGLLRVNRVDGKLVLQENVTEEEEKGGELETVFENGRLVKDQSLSEIRERLAIARA
jgi:nicotinamide phosphoribosyltransferase